MYKVQVIAKKTKQQNKNQKTKKKQQKNKQTARLCMSMGKGGVGVVYWVSFIGICS